MWWIRDNSLEKRLSKSSKLFLRALPPINSISRKVDNPFNTNTTQWRKIDFMTTK